MARDHNHHHHDGEGDMSWMPAWFYDALVFTVTMGRETRQRRELISLAEIQPGDKILDVGCGTGNLAALVARDYPSTKLILGVDPMDSFIARAQAKNNNVPNLEFRVGKAQELPGCDNNFMDVVFSSFAFHHMDGDENQKLALQEMKRVLNPEGGRLVLVDFPGGHHPGHGANPHAHCHHNHGHGHNHCHHIFQHCRAICSHGDTHEDDDVPFNNVDNDPLVVKVKETGFTNVSVQKVAMLDGNAILATL